MIVTLLKEAHHLVVAAGLIAQATGTILPFRYFLGVLERGRVPVMTQLAGTPFLAVLAVGALMTLAITAGKEELALLLATEVRAKERV